jgi:hypothetical protein
LSIKGSAIHPKAFTAELWCQKITTLFLYCTAPHSINSFSAFIMEFTSLKRLTLDGVKWYIPLTVSDPQQLCLPFSLHTLHLRGFYPDNIVQSMLSHNPIIPLHTVTLNLHSQQELIMLAANKFLARLGSSLRHLEFFFYHENGMICHSSYADVSRLKYIIENIDVSQNIELRSLSLRPGNADDFHWLSFTFILSTVSSAHVEEIKLTLKNVRRCDKSRNIWGRIATILERPVFARLKAVKLVLTAPDDSVRTEMRTIMKEYLSSCDDCGLLVFSN